MTPPVTSPTLRHVFGDPAERGDGIALTSSTGSLTWAELDRRVTQRSALFVGSRRLVMLSGRNSIDFVVNYLAALASDCPVLVVTPGQEEAMAAAWDPDIVVDADRDRVDVRRHRSVHGLHPDLALLLSTSGSTGSPKLVRLSHQNLASNAASIADYLDLGAEDCGLTSLPLHYCYGLSILHSHLAVRARVALTDASVLDAGLWDLVESSGVTGLAGVPHTFDLLERSGFADRELPSLRYVTQAGGRLDPDQVSAWHRRGVRNGWDFFVMYGQTEATARMAYLPPDLAESHPGSIGRAVPGGSLDLAPVAGAGEGLEEGVGELVYSGPNVMMGYAEHPADLGLAPMPPILRTGDLARRLPGGLFEVVGRLKRFTKVFGLRVNLDDVERHLAAGGVSARVVGTGGRLGVFVRRRRLTDRARELAAAACGVPTWVVDVDVLRDPPLTANGKPDYARLEALAAERPDRAVDSGVQAEDLRALYARILDRPDARVEDSFVGLGADSLSYVEMSVQLGARLDPLPADWHERSIRSLADGTRSDRGSAAHGRRWSRRWGRTLDTNVVLRAVAIVLIVGSHTEAWVLEGGAHLLLALAGFNFARFHLGTGDGDAPWRRVGRAVAAVAIPASLWIALAGLVTRDYSPSTVAYLNWAFGSPTWDDRWRFWFLEALVWALVGTALVLSVRRVRALEARHPFAVAAAVVLLALGVRWQLVGVTAVGVEKYSVLPVLWVFVLGWLVARSTTWWQRAITSLVIVLSVLDFFDDPRREALVVVGLLLALWVPQVRVPRFAASALGVLAAASLAVYVTHWQVYPHLEQDHPYLAVLASVLVGITYHHLTRPLVALSRRRPRPAPPEPASSAPVDRVVAV